MLDFLLQITFDVHRSLIWEVYILDTKKMALLWYSENTPFRFYSNKINSDVNDVSESGIKIPSR